MTYQSANGVTISPDSMVGRRRDQVSARLEEQTALMSLEGGHYYLIDEIGTEVWSRIETPIRVSDLCAVLVQEFDVTMEACQRDVIGFLGDLVARNLVTVEEV